MIWDRMGDYHRARWKAVETVLADRKVFAADFGASDDLYQWKNTKDSENYFLLSKKRPDQFDWRRFPRLIKILSAEKIGVVCVAGYGRLGYLLILLYSKLSGRKVVLFAESWYSAGRLKDLLKAWFINFFCDRFLVSGSRAFKHFTNYLHVKPSKVKVGYSVVDNDHFSVDNHPLEKLQRLLCVARFAPEKNLIFLVNAFLTSEMEKSGWELCLVGAGPLKNQIEQLAIGHRITLLNWKSYDELPDIYRSASVFILPSFFEPWGLVVNEAMASSLPVILSSEVGCCTDLLMAGNNGWSFNPNDENELSEIFNAVNKKNVSELSQMGRASQKYINGYSLKVFADNLNELIISI